MVRRLLLTYFATRLVSGSGRNPPKLGDVEWLRRFNAFLREVNEFVFAINEERVDRARWERVRSAWLDLEGKDPCDK